MTDDPTAQRLRRTRAVRREVVPGNRTRAVEHAAWPHRCRRCSEFYDAFFPRLEEAIDYCDKFPLDDMPEDALQPAAPDLFADHGRRWRSRSCGQPKPADSADAVIDRISRTASVRRT